MNDKRLQINGTSVDNMKFISFGTKYNTIENHVNAPLFKRVFDCDNATNATLTITAVGLYRLFLNGKELNKSYFAPYMSNPDQLVVRDKYDVGGMLKRKDNVLCVLLGNGFVNNNDLDIWLNQTAPYRSAPKFALEICADGKTIVQTDEGFVVADSPITFDDFRCGERYDARLEIVDVLTSTDIEGFEHVTVVEPPKGEVVANKVQPIVFGKPKKAVRIAKTKQGYLYDFGVNGTGVCKLNLLTAESGQQIDMYFAEEVDGNCELDRRSISFDKTIAEYNQHDVYVCKDGAQTYMPSFTWHGFRYCEVRGLTEEQATAEAVTFVSTCTDIPQVCEFSCDNDTVNKLVAMTLQSDKSNFVFYPYDCPHREKNGWTADAAISAEQMLYSFDAKDSMAQWLLQIRNAQLPDGKLPGIVPTAGWGFDWGNGPAWDSVLVELPYQLYRMYGDEKVVKDNAEAIDKYFDYAASRLNADGLADYGLGDWAQSFSNVEWEFDTPVEITDTLTLVNLADKVAVMFDAVGLPSKKFVDFREVLAQKFRKKYIRSGKLTTKTQTALAMALQNGVFSDDESSVAYAELLDDIHAQNDHFRVGVVGYKYLFETLAEHGDQNLCFKLITQSSFPSYGYLVEQGATTLWECFYEVYRDENGNLVRKDGSTRMPSFNHHFWGGVLSWFYKYIGWVDIVDSDTIEIAPTFIDGINSAKISYTRNGKSIFVTWVRNGDNATATVVVDGFSCLCGDTLLHQGENTLNFQVKK